MITQLNRILQPEQILEILKTLFINRPVKILRTIARTGKYGQSVPWVYMECEITGNRRATFVSLADILEGFWAWLECANLLLMSVIEVATLNRAIWAAVERGVWVFDGELSMAQQVVEKDISKDGKWRLWLRVNGTSREIAPIDLISFC
jgi:hypothetical protein